MSSLWPWFGSSHSLFLIIWKEHFWCVLSDQCCEMGPVLKWLRFNGVILTDPSVPVKSPTILSAQCVCFVLVVFYLKYRNTSHRLESTLGHALQLQRKVSLARLSPWCNQAHISYAYQPHQQKDWNPKRMQRRINKPTNQNSSGKNIAEFVRVEASKVAATTGKV